MRRVLLGAFLFLAACGGGVRSESRTDTRAPSPDTVAARQGFLLNPDATALIAEFAKSFSEDAVDSCLDEWVMVGAGVADPVYKPDLAELRVYLAHCLDGAPVPGDLRAARQANARIAGTASQRSAGW